MLFAIPLLCVGCGSLFYFTEKKEEFDFKKLEELKKNRFKNSASSPKPANVAPPVQVKPIPEAPPAAPAPVHVVPGERAK